MTRSTKKHAITGTTTIPSEKREKVQDHRRLRVELRGKLARGDEDGARFDERAPGWFEKDGKTNWTGQAYETKARRK